MKLLFLNNSVSSKMKKGFRNFCNGDTSTSTLHQTKPLPSPTLEDMILQLEFEEQIARKAHDFSFRPRMSCVNSSDILRSARNALNQYPRFSLDGKDAMYRSSFTNSIARKSSHCIGDHDRMSKDSFPPTLAGERVIWCKPGVVAKLMGLEVMPVPAHKQTLSSIIKRQNLRRRAERHDFERRLSLDINKLTCNGLRKTRVASCSNNNGYCVIKPVAIQPTPNDHRGDWPTRHFY